MKLQTNKMLLVVAVLLLALPMTAGADRYKGDGATQNATNGYWDLPTPSAHVYCLECHGTTPYHSAPDKSAYLLTGHRNLLRKVVPGKPWAGPEGVYTTNVAGVDAADPRHFQMDWVNGKILIDGVPYNLFYAMGDWMNPDVIGIFDKDGDGKTAWTTEDEAYGTCARCHTTGYGSQGAKEPAASFPSITSGITGSWWLDGVQCERCHRDSANDVGGHNCYVNGVLDPTITSYSACSTAKGTYSVNVARGTASTVLCGECHLAAAGWEGTANPSAATQPTAYPLRTSLTSGGVPGFSGHVVGKEFLNSPHGKFTGTKDQITSTATGMYNSHFSDGTCSVAGEFLKKADCEAAGGTWTAFQGGCTTCHDVHQSTAPGIKENFNAEPMKRGCGIACHASSADFSAIHHSSGPGTPMEGGTEAACVTCHMPRPEGASRLMHIFRINVDPGYSTFPNLAAGATTPGICSDPKYLTKSTCEAARKTWYVVANSAPDGTYKNAIWVDLDLACGQCHGGGAKGEGAKVLPMSKATLARYAKNMHGRSYNEPTAAMVAAPTVAGRTVSFVDKSTDRQDETYNLRVKVSWGDGKTSTGQPGGTFTHTYKRPGTFTIKHTATDTDGQTGYESVSVTVGN